MIVIEIIDIANFEVPKQKKERVKKEKPMTVRQLMALEAEAREEARLRWFSEVRYICTCYRDYVKLKSVIEVYDAVLLRSIAVYTLRGHDVMSSRVIQKLESDYRIKLKEEDIYDIGRCHIVTEQRTLIF